MASSRVSLRSLTRLALPAAVGVSVWCAAGLVTVESTTSASARLMAPAPWWVLVIGVIAAALVPGWRRAPLTALPALLATIPWWPIPIPTVGLVWTGPLAWLPILAALAAAEGSRILGVMGAWTGAHDVRRATMLAAALTGVMGAATLGSIGVRVPGGDEPHYLVITQSLLLDGDLRIENNHQRRDYAEYYNGPLQPHFINRGQDGEVYSIHAPGVSALVLPGFALFGLAGAQWTLWGCLVIAGALVWRLAWNASGSTSAAWFAWAAVVGSASFLLLGVMIFPDGPAAVAVAAGAWLLVRWARAEQAVHTRHLVGVSVLLAALPWFHTRFALLAAGFGLAALIAAFTEHGRTVRERWTRVAAFLAVPVLSATAWFLHFWLIYGTVDPRAPYKGAEQIREFIWGAVAGLYLDQQFGLMAFAPVLLVAVVGVFAARGAQGHVCVALVVILSGYTIGVASYHMWWAGLPGLPARFLSATLPMLAVPLAIGWVRATATGRALMLALLAISWMITALLVGYNHGQFAFNARDGQAPWLEWLSPVVNLPRAWPSFFWGTDIDFLRHVAVWFGVWGGGWFLLRAIARRHLERADLSRLVVALWILTGLMGAAVAGWRLHGVPGLDPSRSQLAVHAATTVWPTDRRLRLSVTPDEPALSDHPTPVVMVLGPLPAGDYQVRVRGGDEQARVLTTRIGRSATPLTVWAVPPTSESIWPLSLPAGAGALVFEADSPESASALDVALEPTSASLRLDGQARVSAIAGTGALFFLDDHLFVESTGFWVRGERTAQVVWSEGRGAAGRRRELHLRNGAAANVVTVRQDGWYIDVPLDPWQEHRVTLPAADATGSWRVTLQSASGFVPAVVSGGEDRRNLGFWVDK